MEFIKVDKNTHNIIVDNIQVGFIKADITSVGNVRGYGIGFLTSIKGFNFGDYKKTLKDAKKSSEIRYIKLLDHMKKFQNSIEK